MADLMHGVASILQAVAWPVAAAVIAIFFRKEIRAALSLASWRVKAGAFELELAHQKPIIEAELIEASTQGETQHRIIGQKTRSSLVEELAALARDNPREAVLQAYRRIEDRLREKLDGIDIPDELPHGAIGLARLAEHWHRIPYSAYRAVEGLGTLRNLAAHGRGDVSAEEALQFLAMADGAIYSFEQPVPRNVDKGIDAAD
jgi:hypothetical protein